MGKLTLSVARCPLTEREIAEVICFLASERASFVTGQVVASDGRFDSTGVGLPALRTRLTLTWVQSDECAPVSVLQQPQPSVNAALESNEGRVVFPRSDDTTATSIWQTWERAISASLSSCPSPMRTAHYRLSCPSP